MKGMNQMTTLTIHADDDLAAAVRTAAEQSGRSINVFLKEVIASSLGVSGKRPTTGISRRCRFCRSHRRFRPQAGTEETFAYARN